MIRMDQTVHLSMLSDEERLRFYKSKKWYTEGEYLEEEMVEFLHDMNESDIDEKLYTIGKPAAFSNVNDPHPKDLTKFPEVALQMHSLVSIDKEPQETKYRVFWPAFQLEVSDYVGSKARGEITFIHVYVLVPSDTFLDTGGRGVAYDRTEGARKRDVYCVRLPNSKYVRVDKVLASKLYSHVKATHINRDNVLIVGAHVLTYMPQDLYESKIASEEAVLLKQDNKKR